MVEVLPLLGVWLLAVLTPGPDFVVIVHYATSRSRRHSVMVVAGVCTALLLWATGSMLGLAVLLARLSWLYEIVRLVGAGYLIYLGVRTLWASRRAVDTDTHSDTHSDTHTAEPTGPARRPGSERAPVSLARAWRVGFLTNAANPKAVAFFGSLFGALLPPHPALAVQVSVVAALVGMAATWGRAVRRRPGGPPLPAAAALDRPGDGGRSHHARRPARPRPLRHRGLIPPRPERAVPGSMAR